MYKVFNYFKPEADASVPARDVAEAPEHTAGLCEELLATATLLCLSPFLRAIGLPAVCHLVCRV
jgi:hypothetical protein